MCVLVTIRKECVICTWGNQAANTLLFYFVFVFFGYCLLLNIKKNELFLKNRVNSKDKNIYYSCKKYCKMVEIQSSYFDGDMLGSEYFLLKSRFFFLISDCS